MLTTLNVSVGGSYEDSSGKGSFLAAPRGGEASVGGFRFGEMPPEHAHHGGVNDLLLGSPGVRGGSYRLSCCH
jgi:hypothetical protein